MSKVIKFPRNYLIYWNNGNHGFGIVSCSVTPLAGNIMFVLCSHQNQMGIIFHAIEVRALLRVVQCAAVCVRV